MSREGGAFPSDPMAIPATRDAIERRIESGEISQSDLDILKNSYRTVAMGTTLGSLAFATGTWLLFRSRAPQYNFMVRLSIATSAGAIGSFVGFTIGGVAASMQVNQQMPDAQRKMRVFAEIASESQARMNEGLRGPGGHVPGPGPIRQPLPSSPSPAPSRGASTWDQSVDGETDSSRELDKLGPDSTDFTGTGIDAGAGPASADVGRGRGQGIQGEVGRKTASTWDSIRARAGVASPAPVGIGGRGAGAGAGTGGAGRPGVAPNGVEDERTREQREFDEMLEKERKGVDMIDRWS